MRIARNGAKQAPFAWSERCLAGLQKRKFFSHNRSAGDPLPSVILQPESPFVRFTAGSTKRNWSLTVRMSLLLAAALIAPSLTACASYDDRYGYSRPGDGYNQGRRDRDRDRYRDGRRGGRYLSDNDVIYRDRDGRYYCKRDDGTTGTIVGAIAGGILGNIIAPGGSKTLGTILGGGAGALAGNAIDKNDVRCE